MSKESLPWDEEALISLNKIPSFVRSMAKERIEKAAVSAGLDKVTAAFMNVNKTNIMN